MFYIFIILLLCSLANLHVLSISIPEGYAPRQLMPVRMYHCCAKEPYASNRELPIIYCYYGSPRTVNNTWLTVEAVIDLYPELYDLYQGRSSNEVWEKYEADRSLWSFSILNWRQKNIHLDPFNCTCFGIKTTHDYTLSLRIQEVDNLKVAMFALGVLLFFLSPSFADNPLFYYLMGITIGMLASVLILFYFIVKLLPLKKPAMLGMVAGGSTIALYLFQTFYDNIFLLATKYQEYVIGYLFLSALVSFIVCYRFGPVSNPRSKNLIKWSLQICGLLMVFFSSNLQEITLAVNAVILFFYNVPVFRWILSFFSLSKRLLFPFRPRKRLLTLEEFREQGEVETKQGLEDLRRYCNSPDCRQWQTVMRLRNPHRFAEFMEGKSHVTREEVVDYDEECKRIEYELLTDDSDDDD